MAHRVWYHPNRITPGSRGGKGSRYAVTKNGSLKKGMEEGLKRTDYIHTREERLS